MGTLVPNYHMLVVGSSAQALQDEQAPFHRWSLQLLWYLISGKGIVADRLEQFLKNNIEGLKKDPQSSTPGPRLGFLIHMIVILPDVIVEQAVIDLALQEEIVVVIGAAGEGEFDLPAEWEQRMRNKLPIRLRRFFTSSQSGISSVVKVAREVQNIPNPCALPPQNVE